MVWKTLKVNVESFIAEGEGVVIHVIRTGFEDEYLVVWEDAFREELGKTELMSKAEVEDRFKVVLGKRVGVFAVYKMARSLTYAAFSSWWNGVNV